ncbi:MAG: hypothetical protein RSC68_35325, partial [Acinetobacter sp.]
GIAPLRNWHPAPMHPCGGNRPIAELALRSATFAWLCMHGVWGMCACWGMGGGLRTMVSMRGCLYDAAICLAV